MTFELLKFVKGKTAQKPGYIQRKLLVSKQRADCCDGP